MVCEGLFTRDEAKTHATVPCQPQEALPEQMYRAAAAGQSN
jgi:hypothetical protein